MLGQTTSSVWNVSTGISASPLGVGIDGRSDRAAASETASDSRLLPAAIAGSRSRRRSSSCRCSEQPDRSIQIFQRDGRRGAARIARSYRRQPHAVGVPQRILSRDGWARRLTRNNQCMALQPTAAGSLRSLPAPAGFACAGASSAGAIGAIAGLVVGLDAYAPTAWFAVLELGVPAAITGGVFGFIAGLVTSTARRVKRHHAHSHG